MLPTNLYEKFMLKYSCRLLKFSCDSYVQWTCQIDESTMEIYKYKCYLLWFQIYKSTKQFGFFLCYLLSIIHTIYIFYPCNKTKWYYCLFQLQISAFWIYKVFMFAILEPISFIKTYFQWSEHKTKTGHFYWSLLFGFQYV